MSSVVSVSRNFLEIFAYEKKSMELPKMGFHKKNLEFYLKFAF